MQWNRHEYSATIIRTLYSPRPSKWPVCLPSFPQLNLISLLSALDVCESWMFRTCIYRLFSIIWAMFSVVSSLSTNVFVQMSKSQRNGRHLNGRFVDQKRLFAVFSIDIVLVSSRRLKTIPIKFKSIFPDFHPSRKSSPPSRANFSMVEFFKTASNRYLIRQFSFRKIRCCKKSFRWWFDNFYSISNRNWVNRWILIDFDNVFIVGNF